MNLLDTVRQDTALTPETSFVGACPFDDEPYSIFEVWPDRGMWKCHTCGRGGNLHGYLMERDNIPFHEAKALAALS